MPFCKKCGTQLDFDAAFCDSCGAPVSKTRTPQLNPNTATGGPTLIRNNASYGSVNPEDLPQGFVIDNRYEIKEKLGQGGFGAVYRANDRNLGVDKALKIIPAAVGSDFEAIINLRAETRALINLNHPSIVRVYDFHESGSIKYIDMELIEGKSLSQIKAEAFGCRLPENQVMEYAIQIAEGMAHAHAKGIIHRDIKPQNIIITNDNRIKILDFGIAQTLHTSMSRLVNTGSSGTLVYMSPEQVRGQDVGKESDIYSFGTMLYELLSGKPPFWQGAIEHQILNEQPKPLTGVSRDINSLVMKCLEKDYSKRSFTFKEIAGNPNLPENQYESNEQDQDAFVWIPGGTFLMGSNYNDEKPIHQVTVSGFYISKTPVTQAEFESVMEKNPSCFKNPENPVENVTWWEAKEYCEKVGGRLPTEAEWEYACRAGSTTKYYWGDEMDGDYAWYDENSNQKTQPVAQKKPNAFGLYDMSGNVLEWCSDWHDKNYYKNSQSKDPQGPSSGECRVLRGGSWAFIDLNLRSASRGRYSPANRSYNVGFRCVRSRCG